MSERSRMFERGYQPVRDRFKNQAYAHFARSCLNCAYFYQAEGDEVELCQNESVSSYDVVQDGVNVYCLWWKAYCDTSASKEEVYSSRPGGRNAL